jgi:hypothetical protein
MTGASDTPRSRHPDVAGTVQLMTDEPIEMPASAPLDSFREQWAYQVNRRPWIIPAALLAAGALVLLLRRR